MCTLKYLAESTVLSFCRHYVVISRDGCKLVANFVVDVDTVCLFKTRLDKFWMHQDVMYDFAVDLTGIGDRSVREIS